MAITVKAPIKTLALAAFLTTAACSDDGHGPGTEVNCDTETRSDTFAAGMSKVGGNGMTFVLVTATPTPPDKGDNTWMVDVNDDQGAPAFNAILDVVPFMPDHGHGTTKTAVATPSGVGGTFQVTPVNLWMPGLWEVTLSAADGAANDNVTFSFCIDG